MSLSKTFQLLIYAGLLGFSQATPAAVYDFGNMQSSDAAALSPAGIAEHNFAAEFAQVRQNQLAGDESGKGNASGLSERSLLNAYNMLQSSEAAVSPEPTPASSYAPEPEAYAMILAGLGLIAFTARHRK